MHRSNIWHTFAQPPLGGFAQPPPGGFAQLPPPPRAVAELGNLAQQPPFQQPPFQQPPHAQPAYAPPAYAPPYGYVLFSCLGLFDFYNPIDMSLRLFFLGKLLTGG